MPRGSYHDETGWLNERDGQLVLRRDEGGTWRLDVGFFVYRRAKRLLGKRVRLAGVRDGFDLLAVTNLSPL